jgi:hypothetical protein
MFTPMYKVVLSCVLVLSFISAVHAQSPGGAGTVDGTITDPSGARVPGASVELRNQITGYSRSGQTDSNGSFRFTGLPRIHTTSM